MVTTKCDNAWQCFSMLREALLVGIGKWCSHKEAIVTILDLLNSVGVVVARNDDMISLSTCLNQSLGLQESHLRRDRDVATVNDFPPEIERIVR